MTGGAGIDAENALVYAWTDDEMVGSNIQSSKTASDLWSR
jgi:hypothetical protein